MRLVCRFAEMVEHALPDVGPNHAEVVLYVNNSEGKIPFYEKKEKAVFRQTLSMNNSSNEVK